MIVLIDGDLITYRCSASAENEDATVATHRASELINRIISDTGATSYECWINGSENFRKQVDPEYKAHRALVAKPKHLEYCRAYLLEHFNAKISNGIETDDEIGLLATAYWEHDVPFCVASLDKDLLQLKGKHYQWATSGNTVRYNPDGSIKFKKPWSKPAQHIYMSPLDATKAFYKQMLTGDRADNVEGITGIAEKKAEKAIDPLHDERDMYDLVLAMYGDEERFTRNAKLLWILKNERSEDEVVSHFHTLLKPAEEAEL